MIVWHGGLPGAGKSFEAVVERLIPELKKGRNVKAYIEGLNFERIAECAELPVDQVRAQLVQLERGQLDGDGVIDLVAANDLVILDEAQNFWGNREKMSKRMVAFVSEHRHQGIDFVLMGQDLRDLHSLWRRRVDIRAEFLKLSGLGTSKRYSVTTHRHLGGDKFQKIGTQVRTYDPKYFGTYASHTSEEVKTDDYKDKRATIFATGLFTLGIPAAVVAGLAGAWYAWGYFHPKPAANPVAASPAASAVVAKGSVPPPASTASAPRPVPVVAKSMQEKYLADLSSHARIRLAGVVVAGKRVQGVVEWMEGQRVVERLTLDELRNLGVAVIASDSLVRLVIGEWSAVVTMWPTVDASQVRIADTDVQAARGQAERPPGAVSLGGTFGQSGLMPSGASKPSPAPDPAPPVTVVVRKPT